MSVLIGNTTISDAMFSSNEVKNMYIGNTLVFSRQPKEKEILIYDGISWNDITAGEKTVLANQQKYSSGFYEYVLSGHQ